MKSSFGDMIEREMEQFARDVCDHFWRMEEGYWRRFAGWPWWRQVVELVVLRPWRRLRWWLESLLARVKRRLWSDPESEEFVIEDGGLRDGDG